MQHVNTFISLSTVMDEENEWDQLNAKTWRGLGLTDPIKTVEVCSMLFRLAPGLSGSVDRKSGSFYLPS